MKIAVDVESSTWRERGVLTNAHAASSYGLPVLAIRGKAYGPADLTLRFGPDVKVRPVARRMLTRRSGPIGDFLQRARQAGYEIGGPADAWAD